MKKHKGLKIFGCIVAVIVVFFLIINIIPPKHNVENNPFIVGKGELPLLAAHRGGGENNPENTHCDNTFEWCNEGIEPEKDNLQNLSYLPALAGWPDVYKDNGMLYCADIQELEPRFRDIVEPQGIKSMLHCAIMDRGVFRGYVGFDECTANYLWTQDQISMLQFMAEVLAVFLIKHRSSPSKNSEKPQ